MEQMVIKALPSIFSSLVVAATCGLFGYMLGKIRRDSKKNKAMEDGVKGLLRADLIDRGLHYIEAGTIPPYGMETLRSCYDPYIALGDGDPSVSHIFHKCEGLPVRTD